MTQILDTLIVGGGPAGAFLAHKLAFAGLKVTVLERQHEMKRKVCGEYLCPLGVQILKQEDLENEILGAFEPLYGMLIVTSKNTNVQSHFPHRSKFYGMSVNREVFDNNLLNRARRSGAQIVMGAEVKEISRRGEFWQVATTEQIFIARILIGADGRNSIVSRHFDNDIVNAETRVALHAFLKPLGPVNRQGEMHIFGDGAYNGVNPISKDEVNHSLVLDADDLKRFRDPIKAFNHYLTMSPDLKSRFKPLTESDRITAAFPVQHRTKSIIPATNVALVGDAAGFVDPITGEGMYNALLSSLLLSKEIVHSYHSGLLFSPQIFRNYQRQYRCVLQQKSRLNRLFQKLIRRPRLVEMAARFLLLRQKHADVFIGIIGNIYSPLQGLQKLFF